MSLTSKTLTPPHPNIRIYAQLNAIIRDLTRVKP